MCHLVSLLAVNNNKTRSNKRKGTTSDTASHVMKLVSIGAKIYGSMVDSVSGKRGPSESGQSQVASHMEAIHKKPLSKHSQNHSDCNMQELAHKGHDEPGAEFDMGTIEQGFSIVVAPSNVISNREIDVGVTAKANSERAAAGPLLQGNEAEECDWDRVEAFDGDNAV